MPGAVQARPAAAGPEPITATLHIRLYVVAAVGRNKYYLSVSNYIYHGYVNEKAPVHCQYSVTDTYVRDIEVLSVVTRTMHENCTTPRGRRRRRRGAAFRTMQLAFVSWGMLRAALHCFVLTKFQLNAIPALSHIHVVVSFGDRFYGVAAHTQAYLHIYVSTCHFFMKLSDE